MNLQIPDLQSKIRRNQELYFSNIIYFKRTIPYIINFKTIFIQRWSVYVVLLFKTWLEKNSRSKRTCIDHCINNLILQNHNSLLLFVQNYHVCACFFFLWRNVFKYYQFGKKVVCLLVLTSVLIFNIPNRFIYTWIQNIFFDLIVFIE